MSYKSFFLEIATVIAILQVAACFNETCSGASCIRSWFVKRKSNTSCEPGYDIKDKLRYKNITGDVLLEQL